MSRRYRRNGTPIGPYRVYAMTFEKNFLSGAFELELGHVDTYEEMEAVARLEAVSGRFGYDFDQLLVPKPRDVFDSSLHLTHASIPRIDLSGCSMGGLVFGRCDLSGSRIMGSDLTGAFFGSDMGKNILRRVNFRKSILVKAVFDDADLSGADFTSASIGGAAFTMADLKGANFTNVDLSKVNLYGADLTGAIYPAGGIPLGWQRRSGRLYPRLPRYFIGLRPFLP